MTPIRPVTVIESRRKYVLHLLIIAVLWATAMTMDYRDQAETAQEQAQQMSAQMASCLRGEWRGITPSGEQIACMPAETYNPERGS